MKSFRLFAFVIAPLVLGAALVAAEQLWTCGMHPQIIKKEPGNCPICGMKLTPIRAGSGTAAGQSTEQLQIDPATIQRMNLRTAVVERGPVRRSVRTVGTITYNEQGLRDITTKYEGWLEKVHVNSTWATVKAGDPLFEIYSPDVYNAELNYALAVRAEGEAGGPLTRAALARLQLFDIPAAVIDELKRSGEAKRTIVFRAPADGVVIEKMGVVGQMMKPGERIYRLADLSTVWVQAQVYEKDLPYVKTGEEAMVTTTYGASRKFDGTVDLVLPQVEEQTRAATARIVLKNPDGFLRPGMFVDVMFTAQLSAEAVLVPDMAVLRSGERNTVFVALDHGYFEPREVQLGARSEGGAYEVTAGLKAGERVVTSGQFMLDSESQLREAIQKMLKPTAAAAAPAGSGLTTASGSPAKPSTLPVSPALKPLALAAADAAGALAADDLAQYQMRLPALQSALATFLQEEGSAAGALARFKGGLGRPDTIDAARRDFEPLSTAIADLARQHQLHQTEQLHIFECPMAPATGKGRWLQREGGTRNPFFGSQMPTCGEEIAGPKKTGAIARPLDAAALAAKLPPGHPPLAAAMSAGDFLRSQMGFPVSTAPADGAACGSCGMSAAAMTAGEPCEHPTK